MGELPQGPHDKPGESKEASEKLSAAWGKFADASPKMDLPDDDPSQGPDSDVTKHFKGEHVAESFDEPFWEVGTSDDPALPEQSKDVGGEPEDLGVIGTFFKGIVDSAKEELGWRAAGMIAEAHLPGAGMALVESIRNLSHVVGTIDALDHANGVEVEVPISAFANFPIDLSLAATYSDAPNAGRFSLTVAGNVSLDGPPARFVPKIKPAVTEEHGTPDRRRDAADSPTPTAPSPRGELDEQDNPAQQQNQPDAAPATAPPARIRTIHRPEATLITVAGNVLIPETAAPGAPHAEAGREQSLVVGRQATRTASRPTATEPPATSTTPIVLFVVDARRQRAAVFYYDPHGWVHLAAVLIVDDEKLHILKTWEN